MDLSSLKNEITKITNAKISDENIILLINMPGEMTFMDVVNICRNSNPIHISFIQTIFIKEETM